MNNELNINTPDQSIIKMHKDDISHLYIDLYEPDRLTAGSIENKSRLAETINGSGSYQLTQQGGNVSLSQLYFVTTVGFEPEKLGTFELSYINAFNQSTTQKIENVNQDNRIVFTIQEVIKSFSLKFEKQPLAFSKKSIIKNVRIFGLTQENFQHEIDYIKNLKDDRLIYEKKINNLKSDLQTTLETINTKKNEYDTYIIDLEDKEITLKENIENLNKEKNKLQDDIDQQNREIESSNSKIQAKTNQLSNIEDKSIESIKRSKIILEEIQNLEDKQKKLEKRVNLFPDTLDGFIQRAKKTKQTYGFLATLPLIILCFLLILSWNTIKGFTETITLTSFEAAWIVLIQRIPFTVLVITLASMCIAFLYKMVRYLTEVQQQELNLAKISMLAKDVADSEYSNLNEAALQKIRSDKKIKLIREFLNSEFNRYQQLTEKEKNISHKYSLINQLPFKDKIPFVRQLTEKNK